MILTAVLAGCQSDQPFAPGSLAGPNGVSSIVSAASANSGSITIVLDMQPNRPTDIAFEVKGPRLRSFVLDDDVTSALPDSRTFTRLKAGSYTVKLGTVAGLTLLDLTCQSSGTDNNTFDEASRSVSISLETGESVSCTFVGYIPIWENGDLVTYVQGYWSDDPTPSGLLNDNYISVYGATSGLFEVGIPGTAGFSMMFTGSLELLAYLPAVGPSGPLTSDLIDPTSTSAGGFGGEVTALKLNIDFADAGVLVGTSGIRFGALTLCDITALPLLSGTTVRQTLALSNTLLGGGSAIYTIAQIDPLVRELNAAFGAGSVSQWAQDHLVSGACP
jgi:hypothetical protein